MQVRHHTKVMQSTAGLSAGKIINPSLRWLAALGTSAVVACTLFELVSLDDLNANLFSMSIPYQRLVYFRTACSFNTV